MGGIFDVDRSRLDLGVAREIGADEPPIPGPLTLGVAGRMNAGEPAARPNVAFKRTLLAIVEGIACRAQEHDDLVSSEPHIGDAGRILSAVDGKPMLGTQRLDGRDAVLDRVVAYLVGFAGCPEADL
jgi:hypothetical protein